MPILIVAFSWWNNYDVLYPSEKRTGFSVQFYTHFPIFTYFTR